MIHIHRTDTNDIIVTTSTGGILKVSCDSREERIKSENTLCELATNTNVVIIGATGNMVRMIAA